MMQSEEEEDKKNGHHAQNTHTAPHKTWDSRRSTLAKHDESHKVEAQSDEADDGLSKVHEGCTTPTGTQAGPRRSGSAAKLTPLLRELLLSHARHRRTPLPWDSSRGSASCVADESESESKKEVESRRFKKGLPSNPKSLGRSSNEDETPLKELQRWRGNQKVQNLHSSTVVCRKEDFVSGSNEPPGCSLASVRSVDAVEREPVEESTVVRPTVDDLCVGVDISDSTDFGQQRGPGDTTHIDLVTSPAEEGSDRDTGGKSGEVLTSSGNDSHHDHFDAEQKACISGMENSDRLPVKEGHGGFSCPLVRFARICSVQDDLLVRAEKTSSIVSERGHCAAHRVLIPCGRCSEWFQASCLGVAMLCPGEVYICPKCAALKERRGDKEAKGESSRCDSREEGCSIEERIQKGASSADPKEYVKTVMKHEGNTNEQPSASATNQEYVVRRRDEAALAGSAYCSSECNMKHAAALLQSLKMDDDAKRSKEKEDDKNKKRVRVDLASRSEEELKRPAEERKDLDKAKLKTPPEKGTKGLLLESKKASSGPVEVGHLTVGVKDSQKTQPVPKAQPLTVQPEKRVPRTGEVEKSTADASGLSSSQAGSKKKSELEKEAPLPNGTQALSSRPKAHLTVKQIRHDIGRRLKAIGTERCKDSDDVFVEQEKLRMVSTDIEKDLFVLCQTTDSQYKSKGLFRPVIQGHLSTSSLVRLGPQEITSHELTFWHEPEHNKMKREQWEPHRKRSFKSTRTEVDDDKSHRRQRRMRNQGSEDKDETCQEVVRRDLLSRIPKDTTDQHKAHLFDMNCKICTGRMSVASDDPSPAKKASSSISATERMSSNPRLEYYASLAPAVLPSSAKPPQTIGGTEQRSSILPPMLLPQSPMDDFKTEMVAAHVSYSPGQPVFTSPVSEKPVLTASRMASCGFGLEQDEEEENKKKKEQEAEVRAHTKHAIISVPFASQVIETQALSHLESLWKGFVNLHGVANVLMKAYPVSGSMTGVAEEFPDMLHLDGKILPNKVWDYVGKLRTSGFKDICMIRFHPVTHEEAVGYMSLYGHFNRCQRYGVIYVTCHSLKIVYLIPLPALHPVPKQLLPFDNPDHCI